MQRKWLTVVALLLPFIVVFSVSAFANKPLDVMVNNFLMNERLKPKLEEGVTMVAARPLAEALGAKITWDKSTNTVWINSPNVHSLQTQVNLLQKALAPTSPKEAAQRYAEGLKTRNGALQFAIMSPQLQEKRRESFEAFLWGEGSSSSPWIEEASVDDGVQIKNGVWQFTITLVHNDSTNNKRTGTYDIIVQKYGEHWYLDKD